MACIYDVDKARFHKMLIREFGYSGCDKQACGPGQTHGWRILRGRPMCRPGVFGIRSPAAQVPALLFFNLNFQPSPFNLGRTDPV